MVILSIFAVVYIERIPSRNKALWLMLSGWLMALAYFMFLYRLPGERSKIILDILHMYRDAGAYSGPIAENQALRQILFNMLFYVPFGAITYALNRRMCVTVVIGFFLSVLTEILQCWTGLGWADIDDVVSNVVGLTLGVPISLITKKIINAKQ